MHFAITNLTSILAADLVIWNSRWNRESFLAGMHMILRHASAVDLKDWDRTVQEKSQVIWPPVEPPPPGPQQLAAGPAPDHVTAGALHNPTTVVWPHRWEHDKGPDELLCGHSIRKKSIHQPCPCWAATRRWVCWKRVSA